MEIKDLVYQVTSEIEQVAKYLLPGGKKRGSYWEAGSVKGEAGKSLKLCLSGEKKGVWSDFATSESGDLLELWKISRGLEMKDTIKEVKQYLGIQDDLRPVESFNIEINTNTQVDEKSVTIDEICRTQYFAEQAVIGDIIYNGNNIDLVRTLVDKYDFINLVHRAIFDVMCNMSDKNDFIDVVTLEYELTRDQEYDIVAYYEILAKIRMNTLNANNIKYHIEVLKKLTIDREDEMFNRKLQYDLRNKVPLSVIEEKIQNRKNRLSLISFMNKELTASSVIDLMTEEIKLRRAGKLQSALKTGFDELDAFMPDLEKETYLTIAARPSVGKTAFAMNVIKNSCLQGKKCLFFSFEMSPQQLMYRLTSSISQIDIKTIKSGIYTAYQKDILTAAKETIQNFNLIFKGPECKYFDNFNAAINQIYFQNPDLDLIVIDHIQLMQGNCPDNKNLDLGNISSNIKSLAMRFKVPFIVLSQISRNVEHRQDKTPLASDIRDCGTIEQDSDIILNMSSDKADEKLVNFVFTKNRNGPVGQTKLLFDKQFSNFKEQSEYW